MLMLTLPQTVCMVFDRSVLKGQNEIEHLAMLICSPQARLFLMEKPIRNLRQVYNLLEKQTCSSTSMNQTKDKQVHSISQFNKVTLLALGIG